MTSASPGRDLELKRRRGREVDAGRHQPARRRGHGRGQQHERADDERGWARTPTARRVPHRAEHLDALEGARPPLRGRGASRAAACRRSPPLAWPSARSRNVASRSSTPGKSWPARRTDGGLVQPGERAPTSATAARRRAPRPAPPRGRPPSRTGPSGARRPATRRPRPPAPRRRRRRPRPASPARRAPRPRRSGGGGRRGAGGGAGGRGTGSRVCAGRERNLAAGRRPTRPAMPDCLPARCQPSRRRGAARVGTSLEWGVTSVGRRAPPVRAPIASLSGRPENAGPRGASRPRRPPAARARRTQPGQPGLAPRPAPPPMPVLHVAAECAPFAKAGGLADVVGALPQALDVPTAVVLPFYGGLSGRLAARAGEVELVHAGMVWLDGWFPFEVWRSGAIADDVPLYLVAEPVHFGDDGVYFRASDGAWFERGGGPLPRLPADALGLAPLRPLAARQPSAGRAPPPRPPRRPAPGPPPPRPCQRRPRGPADRPDGPQRRPPRRDRVACVGRRWALPCRTASPSTTSAWSTASRPASATRTPSRP